MAASQKRLEDEMADDENSSEENGHDCKIYFNYFRRYNNLLVCP